MPAVEGGRAIGSVKTKPLVLWRRVAMLVRAALLWIGLNMGILSLLAVVDLALLMKRWVRRSAHRASAVTTEQSPREASVA